MELVKTSWGGSTLPEMLISEWKSQNIKQPLESKLGRRALKCRMHLHLPQYVCTYVNTHDISVLSVNVTTCLKNLP